MNNLNAQEFPYSYTQDNLMVHFIMTAAVSTDLATHTPRGRRGRDTHPVVSEFNPGLALPASKKRSMRGQARGAVGLRRVFTPSFT